MNEYFARQIQLWGEETQRNLAQKRILIVGSGGLGSSLGLSLGSSGIGHISVVDFDKVSLHNIHRQILFDLSDEGKFKAEIFKKRIESRYDGVCVDVYLEKFSDFAKRELKFDLILDATDNMQTRAEICEFALSAKMPWIFASVEGFRGQICFMDGAKFDFVKIDERKPDGIAAPIVMFVAAFEANLALRYLCGLKISKNLLYYVDFSSCEFKVDKFGV